MSDPINLPLLPRPRDLQLLKGHYRIPAGAAISLAGEESRSALPAVRRLQQILEQSLQLRLPLSLGEHGDSRAAFRFSCNRLLAMQAYEISVSAEGVAVTYSSPEGAYYAVATLKQLLEHCGRSLPGLRIVDEPDFAARGLMIDISRNKIPQLATLYRIVDLMADLKLNQLQLYIEGTPFAYESFPAVWELETPITGEEILLLDDYCRERYIDLVPNQNSFGHMEGWLTRPEFNHLAEMPGGFMLPEGMYDSDFHPQGLAMQPGTFHTEDPEVLKLLERMYDDLLPYFTSGLFNVGCDETYELGMGKSKASADSTGKGSLYLSFLKKIQELVEQRGKTMQFWGDIIIQYPELIPQLPKNMIAMEWGYGDDHPFAEDTDKYREAGIPFYICPGTSSWNSLTGRSDNMLGNLRSAAVHGKRNGAAGYLITDWGDHGHWQQLPVSYPGFVYGAALAWQVENNLDTDPVAYLNTFVYRDRSGKIGQLLLDLGNYYRLESGAYRANDTELSMLLRSRLDNFRLSGKLAGAHLDALDSYMAGLEAELALLELHSDDAELVMEELRSGMHFVKHAVSLARLKRLLEHDAGALDSGMIERQIHDLDLLLHHYRACWSRRNRPGGLERSTAQLLRLRGEYTALGQKLKENGTV
ncbi:beta-N-acetylhexosaminidase [Paenibacillus tengchongensis]|uniref:beta-N-acetylhexosaminidase n=1 Tax=Paenibacillus tengchongensis TaxID=2608684 RepID=UPI0016522C19|nr:family 20 glycosylhydrolase [Paenibacillus tengchongensis]